MLLPVISNNESNGFCRGKAFDPTSARNLLSASTITDDEPSSTCTDAFALAEFNSTMLPVMSTRPLSADMFTSLFCAVMSTSPLIASIATPVSPFTSTTPAVTFTDDEPSSTCTDAFALAEFNSTMLPVMSTRPLSADMFTSLFCAVMSTSPLIASIATPVSPFTSTTPAGAFSWTFELKLFMIWSPLVAVLVMVS